MDSQIEALVTILGQVGIGGLGVWLYWQERKDKKKVEENAASERKEDKERIELLTEKVLQVIENNTRQSERVTEKMSTGNGTIERNTQALHTLTQTVFELSKRNSAQ